jgi:peptide chain release factor 2
MDEQRRVAQALAGEITDAWERLDMPRLVEESDSLNTQSQQPDFWNDSPKAQVTMKRIARLENRIDPWRKLRSDLQEVLDLLDMNDNSIADDLTKQLNEISDTFSSLKEELKLNGKYDSYDAILSIYAGAGGPDVAENVPTFL